jgi:hypothetical protein
MPLIGGARAPLRIGAGVVATAGVQCPEGLTPAVDTSGPVAKFLGCKVPETKRTTTSLSSGLLGFGINAVSNFLAPGSGVTKLGVTGLQSELKPGPGPAQYFNPLSVNPIMLGGRTMGFADGDSGFFGSLPSLGDVTKVFQGGFGQQLLNIGTQALSGYVNSQFQPPTIGPSMMAAAPVIARGAGAVATVGRRFFNKFPNLATAIQGYRNMGKNVTRSKLYSLMKRFGPDFLITGGILTAAAVSELAMAGPGRRRMNPGNVKALRRAHRRMKSFHHVCQVNDHLLHARRRRAVPANFGGTRITQVK